MGLQGGNDAAIDGAARFRDLFENAPCAYVFVGADGCVVHANERAGLLTGRAPAALTGVHVLDLCADTHAGKGRARELLAQLLAGEACSDELLELLHADGSSVWVRLSRQPAFDADGGFVGARGVLVDVTARELDRRDRLDGGALQMAALASIGNAVMVTDVDGTIIWVNRAFTVMSGYSADEAVGKTPRLLKSGVHGDDHYDQLWATIRDHRIWRGEIVDRRKDGTRYTVLQTITPILDERGAVTHFVAVHEDVTQLRSSQARLQALFDHALDGILLFDGQGRMVDANPAVTALTGYGPEQLATMTMIDLVPEDHHHRFWELRQHFRTEGRHRGNLPIRHRDGTLVEIEFQAVAGIIGEVDLIIARDVTQQRRAEARQRFQAQLLEAVGDAVIATDLDGILRYANPAAERLYGWSDREVLGLPITEVTVPPDARGDSEDILSHVREGNSWTGQFDVRRHDGTTFTALVTNAPFLDASGEVAGIIGISTDISDLEHTKQLLIRRARQQTAVAELGQLAMSTDDPQWIGTLAHDIAVQLLGPEASVELVGDSTARDSRLTTVPASTDVTKVLHATGPGASELPAEDQEFLRSLSHVVHAAVQRHAATTQLEHMATHDALTGLPNRTLFLDRLEQVRSARQRSDECFAVLFLDLDGLKSVNDGLGHETGDEALRLVAEQLRRVVDPDDTIARFGGDEFAILCPNVPDEPSAGLVAERIRSALDAGLPTRQGTVTVTASIGIVLGDSATDGSALLRDVDTAMYAAKAAGRNRAEVFDARMQDQARHRFHIVAMLQAALEADKIVVHYQPTIEIATGCVVGVEALARLRRDDGTLVAPSEFVWVAEESGMIAALGEQVLRRACADAHDWLEADPEFMLSVNLSPRQLTDRGITQMIEAALADTGVAPTSLWLEITESALLSGPGVHAAMNRLRHDGIRFAIDDFGTGYSSFAHLRQMPVDMLKIDRSFVSGLHADIQDRALVAATIDLAHSFALPTTAEGVETPQQLAELTRLGCNYAQGYLWSPAVGAGTISEMLRAGC